MAKPLFACVVGAACGVVLALWAVARFPVNAGRRPNDPAPATTSVPAPAASSQVPTADRAAAAPRSGASDAEMRGALDRARALADRADVRALMALRDEVVVRAQLSGTLDSTSTKRQVADIDRELERARLMRLKLDREELRREADRASAVKR